MDVKLLLDYEVMLLRWVTVLNVINNRKIHASVYGSINGILKYLEIKFEME